MKYYVIGNSFVTILAGLHAHVCVICVIVIIGSFFSFFSFFSYSRISYRAGVAVLRAPPVPLRLFLPPKPTMTRRNFALTLALAFPNLGRWVERYDETENAGDYARMYLLSMYWAFMTLTTTGYGDMVPLSGATYDESTGKE